MNKIDLIKLAIVGRNKLEFEYLGKFMSLEPYLLSKNRFGNWVVFGRPNNFNVIKSYEIDSLENLTIIKNYKFAPLIPILPAV